MLMNSPLSTRTGGGGGVGFITYIIMAIFILLKYFFTHHIDLVYPVEPSP